MVDAPLRLQLSCPWANCGLPFKYSSKKNSLPGCLRTHANILGTKANAHKAPRPKLRIHKFGGWIGVCANTDSDQNDKKQSRLSRNEHSKRPNLSAKILPKRLRYRRHLRLPQMVSLARSLQRCFPQLCNCKKKTLLEFEWVGVHWTSFLDASLHINPMSPLNTSTG